MRGRCSAPFAGTALLAVPGAALLLRVLGLIVTPVASSPSMQRMANVLSAQGTAAEQGVGQPIR